MVSAVGAVSQLLLSRQEDADLEGATELLADGPRRLSGRRPGSCDRGVQRLRSRNRQWETVKEADHHPHHTRGEEK